MRKIIANIPESSPGILEDPAVKYLERNVRFSLRDCTVGDYCISNLEKNELLKLYKTLGRFEDMTWKMIQQASRESGFSIEQKESSNHRKLSRVYKTFTTFLHFRVNGTNYPFRVFCARDKDLCYILWFDKAGKENH